MAKRKVTTIVVKVTHEDSVSPADLCQFIENLVIDLREVETVEAKTGRGEGR